MATPKCAACKRQRLAGLIIICRQCHREICRFCTCGSPVGPVCTECIDAVWNKIHAEEKARDEAEAKKWE